MYIYMYTQPPQAVSISWQYQKLLRSGTVRRFNGRMAHPPLQGGQVGTFAVESGLFVD